MCAASSALDDERASNELASSIAHGRSPTMQRASRLHMPPIAPPSDRIIAIHRDIAIQRFRAGAVAALPLAVACDNRADAADSNRARRSRGDSVAAMFPRKPSRRDVLRGALAGAMLGAAPLSCSRPQPEPARPAPAAAPKRILILGGTGFLGPKTVAAAIARGHQVTIFNRGKREKLLPLEAKVEHLYGNRDPELPADDERGPDGKL